MSSRSPSPPGPATPESVDGLDAVVNSRWGNGQPAKADNAMLELADIIQDNAYDDNESSSSPSSSSAPPPPAQTRKRTGPQPQQAPASPFPVVSLPRSQCTGLLLLTPNLPAAGTKSRVETQIRVVLDLAQPAPPHARVAAYKWLRLPAGTATKKRTRKEGKIDPKPEETLQLNIEVVCASAPHARVVCCSNCQTRESKRVARKIAQRVRPAASTDPAPPDAPGGFGIVHFNSPEVLDFSNGSCALPLRLTCYCRHHRERRGFVVRFRALDAAGALVGEGESPPIMITDDHKSSSKKGEDLAGAGEAPPAPAAGGKRKAPAAAGRGAKRVKAEAATRPATPVSSSAASPAAGGSPWPAPGSSSFTFASPGPPPELDPLAAFRAPGPPTPPASASDGGSSYDLTSPIAPGPQTHTASLDLGPDFDFGVPLAGPPAVPPYLFFDPALAFAPRAVEPPRIHRLIPAQGPCAGGVEVTVLGAGFAPGAQLEVVFGGVRAASTNRWSENTLVCVLPPRATGGVVPVWIEGAARDGEPDVLFTYTDESDRQLMELALQVVGLKMTGRIEDAKSVARRIIEPGPGPSFGGGGFGGGPGDSAALVLGALALLDAPGGAVPASEALSRVLTAGGQTLLHLAAFARAGALVRALVDRGADVDARDANGCTPLHLAVAAGGCPEVEAALREAGADPEVVDAWGRTAAQVARYGVGAGTAIEEAGDDSDADCDEDDEARAEEQGDEGSAHDDESHWGDAEAESADERAPRRRQRRTRRAPSAAAEHAGLGLGLPAPLAPTDSSEGEERAPAPLPAKGAAAAAGAKDEKLAATLLARLVPHWATQLPVPLVLPAFAFLQPPTPGAGMEGGVVRALLTPQEWRAGWEKWLLSLSTPRTDEPPPVYTPREGAVAEEKATAAVVEAEQAVVEPEPVIEAAAEPESSARAARRATGARRARAEASADVPAVDVDVDGYAYRPAAAAPAKKEDRMLLLFWIPILLIALVWACVHGVRIAANGVRSVTPLRALMRM